MSDIAYLTRPLVQGPHPCIVPVPITLVDRGGIVPQCSDVPATRWRHAPPCTPDGWYLRYPIQLGTPWMERDPYSFTLPSDPPYTQFDGYLQGYIADPRPDQFLSGALAAQREELAWRSHHESRRPSVCPTFAVLRLRRLPRSIAARVAAFLVDSDAFSLQLLHAEADPCVCRLSKNVGFPFILGGPGRWSSCIQRLHHPWMTGFPILGERRPGGQSESIRIWFGKSL